MQYNYPDRRGQTRAQLLVSILKNILTFNFKPLKSSAEVLHTNNYLLNLNYQPEYLLLRFFSYSLNAQYI